MANPVGTVWLQGQFKKPKRLMKSHLSKSSRFSRKTGFALVITLSLMILLTIIAVGLLSLSSISLRSASNSSAMAQARQNARMALMLAMGELQKYAGQDQRVTATANIAGDTQGAQLAAGSQPLNDKSITGSTKGLSAVQPGNTLLDRSLRQHGNHRPRHHHLHQNPQPRHCPVARQRQHHAITPTAAPASCRRTPSTPSAPTAKWGIPPRPWSSPAKIP